MAKETLDESPRAGILFHQSTVLGAKLVALVGLDGDLAFELTNVLCLELANVILTVMGDQALPFLRDRKARAETLLRSWRRSLELSFLPSSEASSRSSSSMSSSSFFARMM